MRTPRKKRGTFVYVLAGGKKGEERGEKKCRLPRWKGKKGEGGGGRDLPAVPPLNQLCHVARRKKKRKERKKDGRPFNSVIGEERRGKR